MGYHGRGASTQWQARHAQRVYPDEGPHEPIITQLVSSRELAGDPRNHYVPLLDIIEIPQNDHKLMFMSLLRPFPSDPHFQTFGEFVAFFTQICEGLQFIHKRNIAHGVTLAASSSCTPSINGDLNDQSNPEMFLLPISDTPNSWRAVFMF